MNAQAVFAGLSVLAVVFCGVGIWSFRKKGFQSISDFFLGDRAVRPSLIVSLLVAGSFSLNGMLYQIYLGYKIGLWALVPQAFWALSFFWLSRYTEKIRSSTGLHKLLGEVFSQNTRKLAALCSIIGLGLQIGWEFEVAKSAFSGLTIPPLPALSVEFAVATVLAIATFYTLSGGLRSNSLSDLLENFLKGACFVLLFLLVIGVSHIFSTPDWGRALLPPVNVAVTELTWVGVPTNILFSIAWQFVDIGTWQAVVATKSETGTDAAARSLRRAGYWVFVAPGIIGTAIGIALVGNSLDANSVLPAVIKLVGDAPWMTFTLTLAISATAMSFIGTTLLAIAFTLITDLLYPATVDREKLLLPPSAETRSDPEYQRAVISIVSWTRVALVVVALVGTYVLEEISYAFGLGLFDQVYIVIITQLALFGPVMVALKGRQPYRFSGELSVLVALVFGIGFAVVGVIFHNADLTTGASIIGLGLSLAIALLLSTKAIRVVAGPTPATPLETQGEGQAK